MTKRSPARLAAFTALIALSITGLCPQAAYAAPPVGDGGFIPAGDWRTIADLSTSTSLSTNFQERGAQQFASSTKEGLVWSPTAANLYTLIYAPKGRPEPVADRTLSLEFQLPTDDSSIGLHLHGDGESGSSILVLVNRSTPERGLMRVYRAPIWPSTNFQSNQIPKALARLSRFPAETWHRLTATSSIDDTTGQTALSIRLSDSSNDSLEGRLEFIVPGAAMPATGDIALRLFSPAGGTIRVRNLLGQPHP